jgi:uncharacterized protein YwgA
VSEILDRNYQAWEIEEVSGIGFRYQAHPRGKILAFYGYADTYEDAMDRLINSAILSEKMSEDLARGARA